MMSPADVHEGYIVSLPAASCRMLSANIKVESVQFIWLVSIGARLWRGSLLETQGLCFLSARAKGAELHV